MLLQMCMAAAAFGVLADSVKPPRLDHHHPPHPVYGESPQYKYSYDVLDSYNHLDFEAREARDGYRTEGSYSVQLPDGRKQTVTYYDHGHGLFAKVTYEGRATYPPPSKYSPPITYKATPITYKATTEVTEPTTKYITSETTTVKVTLPPTTTTAESEEDTEDSDEYSPPVITSKPKIYTQLHPKYPPPPEYPPQIHRYPYFHPEYPQHHSKYPGLPPKYPPHPSKYSPHPVNYPPHLSKYPPHPPKYLPHPPKYPPHPSKYNPYEPEYPPFGDKYPLYSAPDYHNHPFGIAPKYPPKYPDYHVPHSAFIYTKGTRRPKQNPVNKKSESKIKEVEMESEENRAIDVPVLTQSDILKEPRPVMPTDKLVPVESVVTEITVLPDPITEGTVTDETTVTTTETPQSVETEAHETTISGELTTPAVEEITSSQESALTTEATTAA